MYDINFDTKHILRSLEIIRHSHTSLTLRASKYKRIMQLRTIIPHDVCHSLRWTIFDKGIRRRVERFLQIDNSATNIALHNILVHCNDIGALSKRLFQMQMIPKVSLQLVG